MRHISSFYKSVWFWVLLVNILEVFTTVVYTDSPYELQSERLLEMYFGMSGILAPIAVVSSIGRRFQSGIFTREWLAGYSLNSLTAHALGLLLLYSALYYLLLLIGTIALIYWRASQLNFIPPLNGNLPFFCVMGLCECTGLCLMVLPVVILVNGRAAAVVYGVILLLFIGLSAGINAFLGEDAGWAFSRLFPFDLATRIQKEHEVNHLARLLLSTSFFIAMTRLAMPFLVKAQYR